MKAFTISVDISATRFGNPYHVKASTTINVDDDTKLDEIMDVPLGQLILGTAYAPHVADITDASKYDYTAPEDMCSNHR